MNLKLLTAVRALAEAEKSVVSMPRSTGEIQRLRSEIEMLRSSRNDDELKKKLDKLLFLLGDLNAKAHSYARMTVHHTQRQKELHKRIHHSMKADELKKMKKAINALEEKYQQLRRKGGIDPKRLQMIAARIERLKRKTSAGHMAGVHAAERFQAMPIKHRILFPPVPKAEARFEVPAIPEMGKEKPLGFLESNMAPPPRKRGFFRRLF